MRKITCFFLLLFMMATGMAAQTTTPPSSGLGIASSVSDVKVVYSGNSGTNTSLFNYDAVPNACTKTTAKIEKETLKDNNEVLKISNFGLVNIKSGEFNAKEHLMFHIDIYSETETKLAVGALMWAPGDMANQTKVVEIEEGVWTQIDIPVSYFVGDKNPGDFYALRIYDVENGNATETSNNSKTFWIDNVYFYNYEQTLNKIEVSANKLQVEEGRTEQINVKAFDLQGEPLKKGVTYTYFVGDNNNGSVDANGLYKAGTAGTTTTVTVTAAKGDVTLTKDITFENIVKLTRPKDKATEPTITDKNGNVDKEGNNNNAMSIYSDYFKNNRGFDFKTNPTNVTATDATIEEDTYDDGTGKILKISNFKSVGLQLANQITEMSPDKYLMFHIDIFSEDDIKLAIAPITWEPKDMIHEYKVVGIDAKKWTPIDLPIEYFQNKDKKPHDFYAIRISDVDENGNVITDGNGSKTFWINNVYVYNYAQELASLDPTFPETVKAVKKDKTIKIVPTAIDTKEHTFREKNPANSGSKITYTYSIKDGTANEATVNANTGEYTAGTEGTHTVVIVKAKQEAITATPGMMAAAAAEDKEITAEVTIANVGDRPEVTLKAVGRDDKVVTLQLNIASLEEYADIVLKQDDKEIAAINDVPTNVDLRYRIDGLTADTKYTYTLAATVSVKDGAETKSVTGTGTVEAETLADFNPGQVPDGSKEGEKNLRPTEAANKVINLFCSRSIYKKSPLYGMAARDDKDPARNIKKGDQFFTMYTKTPMEIGKLHYTKVEDVPAVVPASVSPRVYSRSCTPKFTDVKWVEEDAPKRSFAKNYALVEASDAENATEEQKNGDYCLRITQFEYNEILFGGADGNIQKSFDCRPDALGPKLKALKMNMCANRDMTVKVSMKNLVNRDPIWKTVTLKQGKWQTVEFNSESDGFTTSMSNCGLILQREAVNGDGYTPDNVTGMLFVDNLYYVLDENSDNTLRKVTEEEAKLKKYTVPNGWHWGDATKNEEEEKDILYDNTDPNIKMAVIAGVFDKYEWEGNIDKAKYESTKAYETLQETIKRKDISWFDCRNVVGLDYQSNSVANLGGNGNAFMLVEPTGGNHSERGVSFPLFSPNNVYMINNDGQEEYYGNYILQHLRQDQYAPTNKNIVRVNANGVKYYQNYTKDRYNTLILPFEGRMESTVKDEKGNVIPAIRGVYAIETATQDTKDDGGKHTIVYFKKLKKEEDNTFKLAANVPYLVVAENRSTEGKENYGEVISIEAIDEHTGLNFDDNNAVKVELGDNNSFTFGGLYHDNTVSSADDAEYKYGDIYVFAAHEGDNYNTLRVGRLKDGGIMHQYRCFFNFANATKEARAKLQFCFDESDGETTNIRLATDEEVRAIVGGIYSIDGKRISNNADDANKLGLPKGMYIINGKKVVIK